MAKHISRNLEKTYQFPNLAHLHVLIKLYPIRSKIRSLHRRLFSAPDFPGYQGRAVISDSFEQATQSYRKNRWAYCENFWESEFHTDILNQLPAKRFLTPVKDITKSYDRGLFWNARSALPDAIKSFPAIAEAYRFLASRAFAQRVYTVAGDGVQRTCYQILMTRAYWGSSVIPHIDSQNDPTRINFIMFIDGTGGEDSGGLGIWRDNEFKERIFEPHILRNTCLFYDMSEAFYHGFKPMRRGTFRWTINAAFSKK